ncbi:MAG: glycosyltransferase [Oscillatoria sp. SIO1A7]|nr:glycosyltransferase [Oscillatoria sp. SIO1A7]
MPDLSISILSFALLLIQLPATAIILSRLILGPFRKPPLEPKKPAPDFLGADLLALASVVLPTLNEAERISPCLAGLTRQGSEVLEIIVVDSRSSDGTLDLVEAAARKDPRFRAIADDPLPPGWVGRPWALDAGFKYSCDLSEWILGIDADTQPHPGLAASLIAEATAENCDLVSLAPQFILKSPGEMLLMPALLMTLVYRFGPAGAPNTGAERVMANGQCFLCRRSVLEQLDGYSSARQSFCDDVTLARNAAKLGFKVAFWDGAKLLKVRMYEGAREAWREWGRSLDLKDAYSTARVWGDLWLLLAVQGLPLLSASILSASILFSIFPESSLSLPPHPTPYTLHPSITLALGLNLFLLAVRFALNFAIAPSYDRTADSASFSWLFWLSPLADPFAFWRIFLSATSRPKQWRGRNY